MLGESIEGREEILGADLAEGHEIGNHTFSHPHALDLDDAELEHDIARCQRLLTAAEPVLFRPPYGEDPLRCARVAARARAADDGALVDRPPGLRSSATRRAIARVIESEAAPGAIIDLHDGWPRRDLHGRDRTPTVEALALAMPAADRAGLRFVTDRRAARGLNDLTLIRARVCGVRPTPRAQYLPRRAQALDLVLVGRS